MMKIKVLWIINHAGVCPWKLLLKYLSAFSDRQTWQQNTRILYDKFGVCWKQFFPADDKLSICKIECSSKYVRIVILESPEKKRSRIFIEEPTQYQVWSLIILVLYSTWQYCILYIKIKGAGNESWVIHKYFCCLNLLPWHMEINYFNWKDLLNHRQ